jgi:hypothetical protein
LFLPYYAADLAVVVVIDVVVVGVVGVVGVAEAVVVLGFPDEKVEEVVVEVEVELVSE